MGLAYQNIEEYSQAIIAYSNSLMISPEYAKVFYRLARIFMKQNKFHLAAYSLNKIGENDDSNIKARNEMANIYFHFKKYDKVMSIYERNIHFYPEHADSHFKLAQIYARMRLNVLALDIYMKAIMLKPDSLEYMYEIAIFLEDNKNILTANACYEYILTLQPKTAAEFCIFANIYYEKGQYYNASHSYL